MDNGHETQREEQRAAAAVETWSRENESVTSKLVASVWLEACGARAVASEEHVR